MEKSKDKAQSVLDQDKGDATLEAGSSAVAAAAAAAAGPVLSPGDVVQVCGLSAPLDEHNGCHGRVLAATEDENGRRWSVETVTGRTLVLDPDNLVFVRRPVASRAPRGDTETARGGVCKATEADRVCRICHSGGPGLFSPCLCKGSHQWVHQTCLQEWREKSSRADAWHTCELCHYRYTVARPWWAEALSDPRAEIVMTIALLVAFISLGRAVWDGWTVFFGAVCNEPEDSFRFVIEVLDYDLGFMFGGVIMAKLGMILFHSIRYQSPDVQNSVGFLSFIVFLVQSRAFAPNARAFPDPRQVWALARERDRGIDLINRAGSVTEPERVTFTQLHMIFKYAPHYLLTVYTLSLLRWCRTVVADVVPGLVLNSARVVTRLVGTEPNDSAKAVQPAAEGGGSLSSDEHSADQAPDAGSAGKDSEGRNGAMLEAALAELRVLRQGEHGAKIEEALANLRLLRDIKKDMKEMVHKGPRRDGDTGRGDTSRPYHMAKTDGVDGLPGSVAGAAQQGAAGGGKSKGAGRTVT